MPLLVEHLRSYISQTACDRRELLFRGLKVLGAARSNDLRVRHFSREHVKATHMPKSAMTMSDDGSLVRKRMFSGLSIVTRYTQIAGEWRRDVLEIPVNDVVIVQVLHARQDRTW